MNEKQMDDVERKVILSLVRIAAEGNVSAATGALQAVERARKTRMAEIHRERMASLDGAELVAYLASLGQTEVEIEARLRRKMKPGEREAWKQARDDRLLEVRAIELGRMRRGDGVVPKWATRKE
jgi:hypothetical protein